ncbi:MAG: sensor histidine kinase [Limnochordia bacterium]|jgi:two-component system sensor histidine kinase DegS
MNEDALRVLDDQAIEKILQDTIKAMHQGKEEIFEIAETARDEYHRTQAELEDLRAEIAEAIAVVDALERKARESRWRLLRVNRDFSRHSEEEIKEAYEEAHRAMVRLMGARERELALRSRRDEMERMLKSIRGLVEKAENFLSNMGIAMDYLIGNLKDASRRIADWRQRGEMAIKVIKAQEEERKRVAREIHDGPAQSVANLVLRAEICERLLAQDTEQVQAELTALKEMARNSLTEIRRIIFDLRPMALDDLGLVPALRRYLEHLKERGLPVHMVILGQEARLDLIQEVTLFRFAQEALNNAEKYAEATEVKLIVEFAPARVTLVVEDNGRGFLLDEVGKDRFGLLGMRERAELLRGECHIDSVPGRGTRIKASIPLSGNKEDL